MLVYILTVVQGMQYFEAFIAVLVMWPAIFVFAKELRTYMVVTIQCVYGVFSVTIMWVWLVMVYVVYDVKKAKGLVTEEVVESAIKVTFWVVFFAIISVAIIYFIRKCMRRKR